MVFIDFAFCFLIKMNVSMFQNAKVQTLFFNIILIFMRKINHFFSNILKNG